MPEDLFRTLRVVRARRDVDGCEGPDSSRLTLLVKSKKAKVAGSTKRMEPSADSDSWEDTASEDYASVRRGRKHSPCRGRRHGGSSGGSKSRVDSGFSPKGRRDASRCGWNKFNAGRGRSSSVDTDERGSSLEPCRRDIRTKNVIRGETILKNRLTCSGLRKIWRYSRESRCPLVSPGTMLESGAS